MGVVENEIDILNFLLSSTLKITRKTTMKIFLGLFIFKYKINNNDVEVVWQKINKICTYNSALSYTKTSGII